VYDTVLQKQKFAVFRLCPTSSCSASKNFVRDNTYGEYFRSQCLSADDIGIQRAEERLIDVEYSLSQCTRDTNICNPEYFVK